MQNVLTECVAYKMRIEYVASAGVMHPAKRITRVYAL
jgi:hypothetical protein